jgi:plasmid stability protein
MDLVIHDVPDKVWEGLDKKAKASGRTIAAEAAAILAEAVQPAKAGDPAEEFLSMVDRMYGSNRPRNIVDEFLAERRELWGEKH